MYHNLNKKTYNFLVILFILFSLTHCLHHDHNAQTKSLEQRQYNDLVDQQKKLQSNINGLVDNLQTIQKNVSVSLKSTDKVFLLESAILSQRQAVFNIQNQIIPPFSLSKTACLELTNEQKIKLLDNINVTRKELLELQKKIQATPKCDKINALEKDAQKQLTLLDSLQTTILTECESKTILTPTIYQTNVYADGWILGDQHIDDLVEQYYQRNIRYHNITNCPLEKPFFNGNQCIKCQGSKPVFNILTRECTVCPQDQQPDSSTRMCSWVAHYTNFTLINNWAQEGAPMPIYAKKQVPCPLAKPYYNGKNCQACLLPKYWSIKKNSCVECPKQTLFDVNDKKCQTPQSWDLTILQGTRWVTNDCNLTRIIKDRVDTLKINQTKKYYKYCPSQMPYYDGITCVSCSSQFNIDTRMCVTTPNKTAAYNENMRCYMQKQVNFETDPRAVNYTAKYPINDSPVPNCKSAKPYYDGVACVDCLDPFPIFNTDTKKCTACDPMQIYNNTQHKCLPREKIYISTNSNHLMATPKMSIADYQEQIRKKITQSPQAIIQLCNDSQYSDYQKCIDCKPEEYFNVQTKKCALCDGSLNQTTKICMQKAYLYTNLNTNSTKRILNMNNTVEQQNATINKNIALHENSKICPKDAPYATKKGCTNCTKQSFDYKTSSCVPVQCTNPAYPTYDPVLDKCSECPTGQRFDNVTQKCIPIQYVTNLNAIYFYIQQDNYTKQNIEDQYFQLQKKFSLIPCEASHPYFDGKQCIDCAINRNTTDVQNHKPYFNLKTKTCQACTKYNNETHKCIDQNITEPKCASDEVFNQATNECVRMVSNVPTLSQSPYVEDQNGTLTNLNSSISQIQKTSKTMVCPKQTPMFSSTLKKCVKCEQPYPYYNLLSFQCQSCDNYDQVKKRCQEQLPRFKMNVEDFYGTIFG